MTTKKPRVPLRVVGPGERAARPAHDRERPFLKFKVVLPATPGWTAWFLDDFRDEEKVLGYTVAAFGHVEHTGGDELVPLIMMPYAQHAFSDPRPMHDFVIITDPAAGKKPQVVANDHAEMLRTWRDWGSVRVPGHSSCRCHSWDDWLCAWIEGAYAPAPELCGCFCHEAARLGDASKVVVPPDAWFFNPPAK